MSDPFHRSSLFHLSSLMTNQRQHRRTSFAHPERVRVLSAGAEQQLGVLTDVSLGGFMATLRKPCAYGEVLNGMIEFPGEAGILQIISFQARCVWSSGHEYGFALRDLPFSSERIYDWLSENAESI